MTVLIPLGAVILGILMMLIATITYANRIIGDTTYNFIWLPGCILTVGGLIGLIMFT